LGYEYIAFTEHNPSVSGHTKSQIESLLKRKREKVEQYNYSLKENKNNRVKYLFNSLEIDILSDGKLSVPEELLELLDFALVSIHSSFRQTKIKATDRILQALSHPKVKIFAHPTGRLLNQREGLEFDWPKIFDFCLKNNKFIEINADPMRLDLPDFLVKEGLKYGVKFSMGTDSHHKDQMKNMRWAVAVARRSWAEKKDIINALSLEEFKKVINSAYSNLQFP
jgi:DNA polymerase (family 10)